MIPPIDSPPVSQGLIARIREVLRASPPAPKAPSAATEFERLSALSDAELAEMGLTRSVLKRHLHQKYGAAKL